MLRFSNKLARQFLCISCLALFFASQTYAVDSTLTSFEARLGHLVYQLSRSVVTVETLRSVEDPRSINHSSEIVQSQISSGLIIDSVGNILVAGASIDHCDRIRVHYNGLTFEASVKGIDYRTGLALITIRGNPGPAVKIADVQQCTGQMVIAMGNSYGIRAAPTLGFCAGARPDGMVQFSAAISSGSVGGGLFDLSGQLIGMIIGSLGQQASHDAGVAVPSISLREAVNYIRTKGSRPAGYVGITTEDIDISPPIELEVGGGRMVRSGSNGGFTVDHGVMVTRVVRESPAAKASLLVGDLLYSINGRAIPSAETLRSRVLATSPGARLILGFVRDGIAHTTELQIGQINAFGFAPDRPASTVSMPVSDQQLMQQQIDSLKRSLHLIEKRLQRSR